MTFTLNGNTYEVPQSLDDVTWANYLKVYYLEKEKLTDLYYRAHTVSILLNVAYEKVRVMDFLEVETLWQQLTPFFNSVGEGVKPIKHFVYGGKTYYATAFSNGVFAQFADYEKIETVYQDAPLDGLTLKLAHLCQMEGEKFGTWGIDARCDEFEDLPASVVLGVGAFFFLNEVQLQNDSRSSSQMEKLTKTMEELRQELKRRLKESSSGGTAGTTRYTRWLHRLLARLTLLYV